MLCLCFLLAWFFELHRFARERVAGGEIRRLEPGLVLRRRIVEVPEHGGGYEDHGTSLHCGRASFNSGVFQSGRLRSLAEK